MKHSAHGLWRVVPTLAISLVACSQSAADTKQEPIERENVKPTELRPLLLKRELLKPGLYEVSALVEEMDYPILPGDSAATRKSIAGSVADQRAGLLTRKSKVCLGIEGQPDPVFDAQPSACTLKKLSIDGGHGSWTLVCPTTKDKPGRELKVESEMSEGSFSQTSDAVTQMAPPGADLRAVRTRGTVKGRWIGECPAGGAKEAK